MVVFWGFSKLKRTHRAPSGITYLLAGPFNAGPYNAKRPKITPIRAGVKRADKVIEKKTDRISRQRYAINSKDKRSNNMK